MSEIVPVVHPVPVRYLPRRGASEKLAFRRCVTPARIRDVDPSRVERVHLGAHADGPIEWLTVPGGGLWVRAGGATADRVAADTAGVLAAHLAGDGDALDAVHESRIRHHLSGTPVVVTERGANGASRGDELGAAVLGKAVDDLETDARDALLRYLDEDVVTAGGTALFRVRPLVRIYAEIDASLVVIGPPHDMRVPTCVPSRIAECMRASQGAPRPARLNAGLRDAIDNLPADALASDGDVRHGANTAAAEVRAQVADASRTFSRDMRAAIEPLSRWAALGAVGAVAPEDRRAAIADAAEGLRAVRAASGGALEGYSSRLKDLDRLGRLLGGYLLPRSLEAMPSPAVADEDEAAFSGMRP